MAEDFGDDLQVHSGLDPGAGGGVAPLVRAVFGFDVGPFGISFEDLIDAGIGQWFVGPFVQEEVFFLIWILTDRVIHDQGEGRFGRKEYDSFFFSFLADYGFVVLEVQVGREKVIDASGAAGCISREQENCIIAGVDFGRLDHFLSVFRCDAFPRLFWQPWFFEVFGWVFGDDLPFAEEAEEAALSADMAVDGVDGYFPIPSGCSGRPVEGFPEFLQVEKVNGFDFFFSKEINEWIQFLPIPVNGGV